MIDPELRPPVVDVALGVAAGHVDGVRRNVDAHARCFFPLAEQRDEEAAGTGADIEDGLRRPVLETLQRSFDERLAVGARDEYGGRDLEIEAPKFLAAED